MVYKTLNPRDNAEYNYKKKESRKGLTSIEYCVKASIQGLVKYS